VVVSAFYACFVKTAMAVSAFYACFAKTAMAVFIFPACFALPSVAGTAFAASLPQYSTSHSLITFPENSVHLPVHV
jgi:hypothetical protein